MFSLLTSIRRTWLYRKTWPYIYWLPTVYLIADFFQLKTINGRSMQPTLNPDSSRWKDTVLFSKYAIRVTHDYRRDDIVLLRSPEDPNHLLIKRIVALEGDTVQTLPPYPIREVVIPKGHVWVEGDEHFVSDDSNHFGPVSRGLIESKLLAIIWPPERFGPADEVTRRDKKGMENEERRRKFRRSRVNISEVDQLSQPQPPN
ncbi:hypothetical protein D9613_005152 [Agrocybe pediades]|uniref:Mitochondrial inner membrane protease subunit n=1 Tax=Agrocybe pediades TaxID=84607 RepID=A0A8H4R019_9AGAR|nr:hypothetical protein D9613_005152 [Agrocybe pediades]